MTAKERFYISTASEDASALAPQYGLGLEIAEFCTASNMDEYFDATNTVVQTYFTRATRFVMHAPFNELHPAAIDPRARTLALERYIQAANLAAGYGITKLVVHSGFVPLIYYRQWQEERSVAFWREVLSSTPESMSFCIENVMEDDPLMIPATVARVDDTRLGLCLDIGHANVCSRLGWKPWLDAAAPYLTHMHIHNNDGKSDLHAGLFDGKISMEDFISDAAARCPRATFTVESLAPRRSIEALFSKRIIS